MLSGHTTLTSLSKTLTLGSKEEKPDSEASFFVEGRLQHCLVLSHVFHDELAVAPKADRRTKASVSLNHEDFPVFGHDRSVVTQGLIRRTLRES